MRISDWSSDVCSSDLAPQTERFWARISPYAGGLRYNASTPANKRGNRVNITTPGETMHVLRSALLPLALLPLVSVAQPSPTARWHLSSHRRFVYDCLFTFTSLLSPFLLSYFFFFFFL